MIAQWSTAGGVFTIRTRQGVRVLAGRTVRQYIERKWALVETRPHPRWDGHIIEIYRSE